MAETIPSEFTVVRSTAGMRQEIHTCPGHLVHTVRLALASNGVTGSVDSIEIRLSHPDPSEPPRYGCKGHLESWPAMADDS